MRFMELQIAIEMGMTPTAWDALPKAERVEILGARVAQNMMRAVEAARAEIGDR